MSYVCRSVKMGFIQRLLIFTLLFSAITSLQWSPQPADGDTVYACVGQDVTLPWAFDLSDGEEIVSIEWMFKGSSEEMVAMYSNNAFLPLPAFSNRVQQVGLGGLTISHVTARDAGNFTIEVTGRDGLVARHSILLNVSDGLQTTDGHVHVTLQSDALLDTASQQWSVVLTCGHFTFTGQPPFPVEWVTPSGAILSSSTYTDGYFHLHLAPPLQGGSYLCRVPQQYLSSACLQANSSAGQASTQVDSGEVRMMLMEAELRALKEDKLQLQQQLNAVQQQLPDVQQQLDGMQQQVSSVNDTLTQHINSAGSTAGAMESVYSRENASLGRATQDVATQPVSFNARSTQRQHLSPPAHLQFDQVQHNQGGAFDNITGDFTAPVAGTYVFVFRTESYSHFGASSVVMVNGAEICRAYIYDFDGDEHGSCPAVVHLNAGDMVWVEPYTGVWYYESLTTSFMGFLLNEDPQ